MKFTTLIEVIGSGSILLVVGVALMGLGVGYGVQQATELPLWACLCGIGLLIAIGGFILVDRGSEEAEEQVKNLPSVEVIRSPLWGVGAAMLGGIFLYRLFHGQSVVKEVIVERTPVSTVGGDVPDESKRADESVGAQSTGFSFSQFIGDQIRSIGPLAVSMAVPMAMKSLGIPSVEEIIQEIFTPTPKGTTSTTAANSADNPRETVPPRGSPYFQSHNGGFNRPEETPRG